MLDFRDLPRPYPRRFAPEDLDLGDWKALEPLFEDLESRALATSKALEQAMLDLSELVAAVEEEGSIRYIRMTVDTTHPDNEREYLQFVENVVPRATQGLQRVLRTMAGSPAWARLEPQRYHVLKRVVENEIALFREENLPLEVEEQKLGQRYQKVMGTMVVEHEGRELTLEQMGKFLEEPDRRLRATAWEKIAERRLKDRHELDNIFTELVKLRKAQATNANFPTYWDYAFRKRNRFDYTTEDCEKFHQGVERHLVPLLREVQKRRAKQMGVRPFRPWDTLADPLGRPPLRPFQTVQELIGGGREVFRRVDAQLGKQFAYVAELGLLDLENRKGKAPGGYMSELAERRLPFIFMNAVGRDADLWTLLHEAGHAFHVFATQHEPLRFYRQSPFEFAEVASMGMELLSEPHLEVFYSRENAQWSRQEHFYGVVRLLAWVAVIDAFQLWLYHHPEHTAVERRKVWRDLRLRFGGFEDWSGYEEALDNEWHRQLHLFLYPLYYIEYGIAQLGALGIWLAARKDPIGAVEWYKRALAQGGARPLPELFELVGVPFDFGPDAVGRAVAGLAQVLLD